MAIEARTILSEASAILVAAGIDSAKGDARLLLGIALGHDRAVLPHETLPYYSDADAARFDDLLARRCGGEPASRIRGWREFWSLRFGLSAGTLDPRPDSEILVERAIGFAKHSVDLRLLDIGTGSGILAIAIAKRFNVDVMASDIDPIAIDVARENAGINGVEDRIDLVVSEGLDSDVIMASAPYDLVLANIVANPLVALAPGISGIVADGGHVILSGILLEQADSVAAAYAGNGLILKDRIDLGNWSTLILTDQAV